MQQSWSKTRRVMRGGAEACAPGNPRVLGVEEAREAVVMHNRARRGWRGRVRQVVSTWWAMAVNRVVAWGMGG